MTFCVRLTEHRAIYPAAIESDANRNVKTLVLKAAESSLGGSSQARKESVRLTQLTEARTSSCPIFINLLFFRRLESEASDFAILFSLCFDLARYMA